MTSHVRSTGSATSKCSVWTSVATLFPGEHRRPLLGERLERLFAVLGVERDFVRALLEQQPFRDAAREPAIDRRLRSLDGDRSIFRDLRRDLDALVVRFSC